MAELKKPMRTMSDLGPRRAPVASAPAPRTAPTPAPRMDSTSATRRSDDIAPKKIVKEPEVTPKPVVEDDFFTFEEVEPQQPAVKVAPVAPVAPVVAVAPAKPVAPVKPVTPAKQATPAKTAAPAPSPKQTTKQMTNTADQSFADAIRKPKKSSAFKTFMQFTLGLLIIVGVAAAIVLLYVKYAQ